VLVDPLDVFLHALLHLFDLVERCQANVSLCMTRVNIGCVAKSVTVVLTEMSHSEGIWFTEPGGCDHMVGFIVEGHS